MPDLSAQQIVEVQNLLQRLCPRLGAALSDQLRNDVTLDLLDVRTVSLTELLARSESVLQTLFAFNHPEASECLFLAPEEAGRIFVDLMLGSFGSGSTEPLTDTELDDLAAVMSG